MTRKAVAARHDERQADADEFVAHVARVLAIWVVVAAQPEDEEAASTVQVFVLELPPVVAAVRVEVVASRRWVRVAAAVVVWVSAACDLDRSRPMRANHFRAAQYRFVDRVDRGRVCASDTDRARAMDRVVRSACASCVDRRAQALRVRAGRGDVF